MAWLKWSEKVLHKERREMSGEWEGMGTIALVGPLAASRKGSKDWPSWRDCSDRCRCSLLYIVLCLLGLGSQFLHSRRPISGLLFNRVYRLSLLVSWGDAVFNFLVSYLPFVEPGAKKGYMGRSFIPQSTRAVMVFLGGRRAEKERSEV